MASHHRISHDVADTTPLLADPGHNRPKSTIAAIKDELVYATKATLQCSITNVLLICLPLGLYGGEWGFPGWAIFLLNFLAMLPLASILTFSTEQLAAIVGSVAGGLINATFGNAVEMIVGSIFSSDLHTSSLTMDDTGWHQCLERGGNRDCAVEYDRKYPVIHSTGMPPCAIYIVHANPL